MLPRVAVRGTLTEQFLAHAGRQTPLSPLYLTPPLRLYSRSKTSNARLHARPATASDAAAVARARNGTNANGDDDVASGVEPRDEREAGAAQPPSRRQRSSNLGGGELKLELGARTASSIDRLLLPGVDRPPKQQADGSRPAVPEHIQQALLEMGDGEASEEESGARGTAAASELDVMMHAPGDEFGRRAETAPGRARFVSSHSSASVASGHGSDGRDAISDGREGLEVSVSMHQLMPSARPTSSPGLTRQRAASSAILTRPRHPSAHPSSALPAGRSASRLGLLRASHPLGAPQTLHAPPLSALAPPPSRSAVAHLSHGLLAHDVDVGLGASLQRSSSAVSLRASLLSATSSAATLRHTLSVGGSLADESEKAAAAPLEERAPPRGGQPNRPQPAAAHYPLAFVIQDEKKQCTVMDEQSVVAEDRAEDRGTHAALAFRIKRPPTYRGPKWVEPIPDVDAHGRPCWTIVPRRRETWGSPHYM